MKNFSISLAGGSALALVALAAMTVPSVAAARGHVSVGVGVGIPGPYYGHRRYYGPGYYYPPAYYGPGYYYAPPPEAVYDRPRIVRQPPQPVIVDAPPAFWYWCPQAERYFPYVEECPDGWQAVPAPEQADDEDRPAAPAPAGRVTYSLGDVLFQTGRAELQDGAVATLDTLLDSIENEPERRIVIEGHTDSVGNREDNQRLSQDRANEVKGYLVEHGVDPDRIKAVGRGEAGAVADNATAEGRQRNRRVDVIVS